ncbi:MAG TPA: hypothetical protein VM101_09405 [Flavitalea sp.]|nr:hypothetical protein [Flavitalea sp.]
MDRIIFGDNQFFAVNHVSDEKSRSQSIRFKDNDTIIKTLDIAREAGINTFMCTTHNRIAEICDVIRDNSLKYEEFSIYPCMPYAYKYANAVTELGIVGTLKQYLPDNIIGSMFKGGAAILLKDYVAIMELLVDLEMKMFKGLQTPVIFLQNVVTDLLLGLGMIDILKAFKFYIEKRYNAEAGFITMNMPRLLHEFEKAGIKNPIICTSINLAGFRMPGGKDLYESVLKTKEARIIAMQVLGGGAINTKEAIEYVCNLPNITSILFGASSRVHINQTVNYINKFNKVLV